MAIELSKAPVITSPSSTCSDATVAWCAWNAVRSSPDSRSQTRTNPSVSPDTTSPLIRSTSTAQTAPSCPASVRATLRVLVLRTLSVRSDEPVTSTSPLRSMVHSSSLWPPLSTVLL
eukprot:Amastigsp_a845055_8.p4 type:complete len:117 gc:universal Amastigsp_a845055_8:553-903(+)